MDAETGSMAGLLAMLPVRSFRFLCPPAHRYHVHPASGERLVDTCERMEAEEKCS